MIKKTALALAALVAGVSAQAQEGSSLAVTLDVTYVSDYVFRGIRYDQASVQPSVEAAYGDFYAGLWHTSGISSDTNATETDLYAGYGFAVTDVVSLDAGVTRYTYSGGSGFDSTEIYFGGSADVLLTPSVYLYYDFDLEVYTVETSVGYSIPVDAIKASIDLSGKIGYARADDAPAGSIEDYTYFVAGVAIPFALSETATLTVGVDYIYNTEEDITNFSLSDGESDTFVGKVGISIGF